MSRFLDRLAGLPAAERGANEGVVLNLVSTCLLHDRFRMSG